MPGALLSARVKDSVFARLGVAATYTPPGGGAPVPCLVLLSTSGDQVADIGAIQVVTNARAYRVRVAEVAAPKEGGFFTVDGEDHEITAAPRRVDRHRLVWTCEVAE